MSEDSRVVSWFSCGAASAIATKLTLNDYKDREVVIAYCETGAEHEDNERFLKDCEEWYGQEIIRLRSTEYKTTWEVWEKRKYLSGVRGALCTSELKVLPRLEFQRPDDTHVFGYTYDKRDRDRAKRLRETFFELEVVTPLIENRITKEGCLSLIRQANIEIPIGYKLGFHNNNCIPCVKSENASYWAIIRKHFPEEFKRMADLSRRLNVKLIVIKGERLFLDQLPKNQSLRKPIAPRCDFMCGALEMQEDDQE